MNIGLPAASHKDEVDLVGNPNRVSCPVTLRAVNGPDFRLAATDAKVIIYDVFHDVGHFLLPEPDSVLRTPKSSQ